MELVREMEATGRRQVSHSESRELSGCVRRTQKLHDSRGLLTVEFVVTGTPSGIGSPEQPGPRQGPRSGAVGSLGHWPHGRGAGLTVVTENTEKSKFEGLVWDGGSKTGKPKTG